MRYAIKGGVALAALVALASCGSFDGRNDRGLETAPAPQPSQATASDVPVKLGAPFVIGGTSYTPVDIPNYDEVGFASYYGNELAGRPTANGEFFNPAGVTAAHKTLPMPSYVEVTALDTGRTILVRINDRGPFANDRLIDLSEGAARQLGITAQGVSGVRVRRVNPPEQERAVLRDGLPAAERIETPESLLKVLREKLAKMPRPTGATSAPKPVAGKAPVQTAKPQDGRFIREGGSPATVGKPTAATQKVTTPKPAATASGAYVVQFGAFSSRGHADALAKRAAAKVYTSGGLHRVRIGPFSTEAEAERAAASARTRGLSGKVMRN